MNIVINVNDNIVTIDTESRNVVFPIEYNGIDTIRYDTVTTIGSTSYVDANAPNMIFTMASILATALSLWQASAPTANDMWEKIKIMRTKKNAGGVYILGDWYHSDPETLAQYSIMYAAISVNSLPNMYIFSPKWKTMGREFRPMTVLLLKRIINTGMVNASLNFANAERHKLAMMSSYVPSTYNYSDGWVPVFSN